MTLRLVKLYKQEILDETGCCEGIRFIVELISLQSVKDNIESLERTAWETYKSLFLKKTTEQNRCFYVKKKNSKESD